MVAHRATRATVDIVPRWETHNLDPLAGALRAADARLRVPTRTHALRYDQSTIPAGHFSSEDQGQPLASRGTDTVRILRRRMGAEAR